MLAGLSGCATGSVLALHRQCLQVTAVSVEQEPRGAGRREPGTPRIVTRVGVVGDDGFGDGAAKPNLLWCSNPHSSRGTPGTSARRRRLGAADDLAHPHGKAGKLLKAISPLGKWLMSRFSTDTNVFGEEPHQAIGEDHSRAVGGEVIEPVRVCSVRAIPLLCSELVDLAPTAGP